MYNYIRILAINAEFRTKGGKDRVDNVYKI